MIGVLINVLGVLAVVALTIGTAVFVAAEFSLTALERSTPSTYTARTARCRSSSPARRSASRSRR
jgi:CBS domain containing-hemolysin-like protein